VEPARQVLMLGFDADSGPRVQRRYAQRWPQVEFTALDHLPADPSPLLMPNWSAVLLSFSSPDFAAFPALVHDLQERTPGVPVAVVARRAARESAAQQVAGDRWPVIESERLAGLTAALADPRSRPPRPDHRHERAEKLRLQDQLTKIAASVPGVIYTYRLGPDGRVTFPYASPTLAAIFGVTFHNLEQDGSPVFAVVHPEDLAGLQEGIATSAATLTPWYCEFRIHHPTRGERWMEGRSVPQREPDGGTIWHGFVADITERKQREAALAASERENRAKQALLRTLLDSIPDLVFFKDRQSRYLGCNKAFEVYSGACEHELIGKSDLDFAAADIAEGYRALDREILASGEARQVEEWIPFKRGGGATFETLKTPFRGPDGRVLGMIGISRDITERTQAKRALEESRARYRFLFDGMMEGCAYCQMVEAPGQPADYVHLNVNASFERLTGLRDARGKRITELLPDIRATNPELFEIYGRVARTGVPEHFEDYVPSLQQWFAISVSSPERGFFVTVFEVITARKQAEQALRQSEQRFRTTLDAMMEGCQIIGADGYYLYVNDSGALHARKPKEELIGRLITDVYPGFEQTTIYAELQKCLAHGVSKQLQNEFVYADGERRWFDLSLHRVPEGLFILSIDITERRQAEEVIRQSEERFRQLFDRVTKLAVQGYGPDGTVRLWNKASETLYGYTAEEAIGRNLVDLIIPPDQREAVRAAIHRMVTSGMEHHAEELRLMRKDGKLVPVYSNHTIVDVHGRGKELYCIDIDLTELKRAEAELQHSQERLTLAIATAQLGVWEWNRARDEVYCTPDCLRIWGTTEARITGDAFRQRLHPADRAHVLAQYQAAVETGQDFAREYRIVRPDQQVRWISDRGHIRYGPDGTVASVVGTVQDITERKQADAGLRLQSAALEAAANAIVITNSEGHHRVGQFGLCPQHRLHRRGSHRPQPARSHPVRQP
jgi:PAS domain S-box-containing protein